MRRLSGLRPPFKTPPSRTNTTLSTTSNKWKNRLPQNCTSHASQTILAPGMKPDNQCQPSNTRRHPTMPQNVQLAHSPSAETNA